MAGPIGSNLLHRTLLLAAIGCGASLLLVPIHGIIGLGLCAIALADLGLVTSGAAFWATGWAGAGGRQTRSVRYNPPGHGPSALPLLGVPEILRSVARALNRGRKLGKLAPAVAPREGASIMKLHNSLTGRKEVFEPADPARPTMYVCGPTVYNYAHIGNARPAVVFDVLFRLLRHRYGDVRYARNVTDVEDKIIKAAQDQGVPTEAIVARYIPAYHDDMTALGVLPPTVEPFATRHVPQMLAMIEALVARRHAYHAEGHVLFHVPSFPAYGRLSRRTREEMIDGARVEVAPYKRDPADFVLWKPSSPDQPGWDSPYGRGRPGWHIECSAMIETHLGATIDIHGGGQDLKFPHHENELAQSSCVHGRPLARFWLHNGFLNVEHEKMAKSVGNVLLVRDLLSEAPGEAIRYALLGTHYRKPLDWTTSGLRRARQALDRLYRTLEQLPEPPMPEVPPPKGVLQALEDDLNIPKAFAELFALAHRAHTSTDQGERRRIKGQLLAAGGLLGLLGQEPAVWFKGAAGAAGLPPAEIERLIEARAAARRARDFAEADRIRDRLAAAGVVLEDAAGKTSWRLAG